MYHNQMRIRTHCATLESWTCPYAQVQLDERDKQMRLLQKKTAVLREETVGMYRDMLLGKVSF